jgi:hypothetical protein
VLGLLLVAAGIAACQRPDPTGTAGAAGGAGQGGRGASSTGGAAADAAIEVDVPSASDGSLPVDVASAADTADAVAIEAPPVEVPPPAARQVTFLAFGDPQYGGGPGDKNSFHIQALDASPELRWPAGFSRAGMAVGEYRWAAYHDAESGCDQYAVRQCAYPHCPGRNKGPETTKRVG